MRRILIISLLLLSACQPETKQDYRLHTVTSGSLELSIPETGELGSAQEIWVNSPFAGTLSQLLAEGSVVKKGQVVGHLETSKQVLERNNAQLSISDAQNDLKLAERDRFKRSEDVKARLGIARLSSQIESTKLSQLKEERDQVALTRARETLRSLGQRMQILELEARERTRLYGLGYLSREERDQAQLQLDQAKKEREQLEADLKVLELGPRKQELERQQLMVQRAKDDQRAIQQETRVQQRVAEVQKRSAQSRISKYQQRYKYYDDMVKAGSLVAPASGTLVYGKLQVGEEEVPIKSGDALQEGVQIVQLVDLAQPVLRLMVHEIDAPQIKANQSARLRFDAWPEKVYQGKVIRILPVARQPEAADKQEVRQFSCEIRLLEQDKNLRPGMTAQAEIITQHLEKALLVPTEALYSEGTKKYCQLLVNGVAQQREVTTGASNARMTEISKGLQAGDQVILNPQPLQDSPEGARR